MGLFGEKKYDRAKSLARAGKAQGKGKKKKAIAEYRTVLKHEPDNPVILAKLATALAQVKELDEARRHFFAVIEIYEKQAFDDKALAVLRQAVAFLPREVSLWERIARLDTQRGRPADAIRALLEGSRHFRGHAARESAIKLLREATRIEPFHLDATLELARQLVKAGSRAEAKRLYEGLCARNRARNLRRVRAAMLRTSPTPLALWRWARAALRGV